MKTICYLTLFCLIYNITIFAQSDTLTNVIKWEESSGGNGHWYGIVKIIKEWSDADTLARTIWHEGKAGYLATITSDEENQFIIDSVLNGINNPSGYDEYNLGATCLDDSCLWITGEIFEYAHWAPSQPASYVDKGTVMMWGTSSVTYGDPGDWEEWYFDHGHFWSIIEWGGLPDNDSDGMPNLWDNCIDAFNPDQLDSDDDGHGDVCDNCPQSGPQWPEQGDVDNDGVGNYCDNCPDTYNPDQADTYGNSMGDACESPSDINDTNNIKNLPEKYCLMQNSPNPFNLSTEIKFVLPKISHIKINLFDISGQKIKTLANGNYETGTHTIYWDGRNSNGLVVSSGIYFYRIQSTDFTQTKKMILIK